VSEWAICLSANCCFSELALSIKIQLSVFDYYKANLINIHSLICQSGLGFAIVTIEKIYISPKKQI